MGIAPQYSETACYALMCELDNAAFEALMEGEIEHSAELQEDSDRLEIALSNHDSEAMDAMLAKYSTAVSTYRRLSS